MCQDMPLYAPPPGPTRCAAPPFPQESLADVMDICAVMELEARGLMENCEQIALEQLHSQEQTERTMVQGHVDAKLGVQAAAEQYFSVAGLTQQYQLMVPCLHPPCEPQKNPKKGQRTCQGHPLSRLPPAASVDRV